MINNVVLVGRLTREVDLRYTQSGVARASFTVAVDRNYRNAQGDRQTDFINCVMWRQSAENFAKYTRKGSLVGIEGSIQTRNYENNQGQRVYVTEVVANNFSLLEPKSVTESRPQNTNDTGNNYGGNTYSDFSQESYGNQGGYGNNNTYANQNQSNNSSSSSFSDNDGNNQDPFAGNANENPFPSDNDNDDSSINISDDDLPF